MKSAAELNRLLLKFLSLCYYGGYLRRFSQRQCKIQLPRDNLREQKILESAFSGFQRA